ncbi:uncharacterized protein A4U43_C03F20370 [Asparagus officinalis]|uniref:Uncharacterized protein n=1 Tax=Asparagus officinalis TaxID=4686 RepID=A0A5P1FGS1_ASPOF|nr:uncharacterized protein A4U43_C03F20370 [Asparagus officinalis]
MTDSSGRASLGGALRRSGFRRRWWLPSALILRVSTEEARASAWRSALSRGLSSEGRRVCWLRGLAEVVVGTWLDGYLLGVGGVAEVWRRVVKGDGEDTGGAVWWRRELQRRQDVSWGVRADRVRGRLELVLRGLVWLMAQPRCSVAVGSGPWQDGQRLWACGAASGLSALAMRRPNGREERRGEAGGSRWRCAGVMEEELGLLSVGGACGCVVE